MLNLFLKCLLPVMGVLLEVCHHVVRPPGFCDQVVDDFPDGVAELSIAGGSHYVAEVFPPIHTELLQVDA